MLWLHAASSSAGAALGEQSLIIPLTWYSPRLLMGQKEGSLYRGGWEGMDFTGTGW